MPARLKLVDRQTPMLLAVDLREWVAKDDLAHLIIELVEGVDLEQAAVNDRGTGSTQYPPGMMLSLLVYSYAQGVFSSRKIERMTYQHVGTRYICADTHPDHDTIAVFRRKNDALLKATFTHVLQVARELKLLNVGTVYVDGTKILANASKRATLREEQLQAELERADQAVAAGLVAQAEAADQREDDEAYRLPKELADAAQRKARLEAAKAVLAERKRQRTPEQRDTSINTTDPDSRLMPTMQGPFVQGYNAQLAVEEGGLIVGQNVVTSSNDRQQLEPTVGAIPPKCGTLDQVVADTGYDHHEQIVRLEKQRNVLIYVPPQRDGRPLSTRRRSRQRQLRMAERERRAARVGTSLGRELLYRRQTTIEPVFGLIKRVFGFTRFSLRGLPRVKTEWSLLTLAFNCWRLWHRTSKRR